MNRREFLQASSGLILSAAAGYAGEFADQKPRVGLIGCGWYGKCDLLRLIQVAPIEVVSMCDVDKKISVFPNNRRPKSTLLGPALFIETTIVSVFSFAAINIVEG